MIKLIDRSYIYKYMIDRLQRIQLKKDWPRKSENLVGKLKLKKNGDYPRMKSKSGPKNRCPPSWLMSEISKITSPL